MLQVVVVASAVLGVSEKIHEFSQMTTASTGVAPTHVWVRSAAPALRGLYMYSDNSHRVGIKVKSFAFRIGANTIY